MKRLAPLLLLTVWLLIPDSWLLDFVARADEYDELQKQKEEKLEELNVKKEEESKTRAKHMSVAGQAGSLRSQITGINEEIDQKKKRIAKLEGQKGEKEKDLAQKIEERNDLIAALYKTGQVSPLRFFFGAQTFARLAQSLTYYRGVLLEGKKRAEVLGAEVVQIKVGLISAKEEKADLEKAVAALSQKKKVLDAELSQISNYLTDLTSQIVGIQGEISHLSLRQEDLIREKLSATAQFTSVGDSEEAKQVLPLPPFSPAYVVISLGYPHRVGLNQYGALGRARAGQSAEDIIKSYYQGVEVRKDYSGPEDIEVIGYGRINFEEKYLPGIAEMPSRWANEGGFEALKAQAIAARTYAINVTDGGRRAICSSQACQVYYPPKVTAASAERWRQAVRETRGWVVVKDNQPIRAYYASTFGGYSRLPTDFDVRWNRSFDFLKRIHDADGTGFSYDGPKYGDSPWYYKAWYAPLDVHPYLTKEEMLDLLNAALLPEDYNGSLSHPDHGGWSRAEVLKKLSDLGIRKIDDLSSIQPVFADEGYTRLLRVNFGGGHVDVDGKRFRKIFTLRSRGKLALWSSLYDVVVK